MSKTITEQLIIIKEILGDGRKNCLTGKKKRKKVVKDNE